MKWLPNVRLSLTSVFVFVDKHQYEDFAFTEKSVCLCLNIFSDRYSISVHFLQYQHLPLEIHNCRISFHHVSAAVLIDSFYFHM